MEWVGAGRQKATNGRAWLALPFSDKLWGAAVPIRMVRSLPWMMACHSVSSVLSVISGLERSVIRETCEPVA